MKRDSLIFDLISKEEDRQRRGIELIASENFTSKQVMEAAGSVLTNKYAEGLPSKRYYGGCEVVDEIEQLAIDRAKKLFGAAWANVQPHSGAQANAAVMLACLNAGDAILGFDLAHGGHLTHGSPVNFSGKLYQANFYGVEEATGVIDYDKVAEKARAIALNVSEKFNHVGLLAVEMFQTIDDEIIVNEVAPRPHNSGHHTIEASFTSQFENHIRAILDLPLGNTDSKVAGIMVNLVGEEGFSGPVIYENIEKIMAIDGVTPHIYGKKETRPFRKMGHVTIVNEDMAAARKIAEEVKNSIRVISEVK